MSILQTVGKHYREAKAELQGKAISRARMIKQAKDIPMLEEALKVSGPPQRIRGATVKMADGERLSFFTDGSLRRGAPRLTRAEKKAAKRARQRAR